jgi:hypothetical protein
MGGFAAGASTNGRFPTVVPVLAIKVQSASKETLRLGDAADEVFPNHERTLSGRGDLL